MFKKIFFYLQYLFFDPPWDTGISPPELRAFIAEHDPGCALDLGCGTGTNAVTLAEHGWQVTGVDYVPQAIWAARRKAKKAGVAHLTEFKVDDVLEADLGAESFNLVLDIGCFHSFAAQDIEHYSDLVQRLTAPRGFLLLYTHLKRDPMDIQGASEEDLNVLEGHLTLIHRQDGMEGASRPSSWLTFQKMG